MIPKIRWWRISRRLNSQTTYKGMDHISKTEAAPKRLGCGQSRSRWEKS